MVLNKLFMAVLALFCFAQIASADDTGLTKSFSDCMEKAGGVTVDMLNCISAEAQTQDARLNKAYKEVMAELSPARKKLLQVAQRAWIKFRDANCEFYADPDGGSSAALSSNDCFMSTTASRAKELERFKK